MHVITVIMNRYMTSLYISNKWVTFIPYPGFRKGTHNNCLNFHLPSYICSSYINIAEIKKFNTLIITYIEIIRQYCVLPQQ